MTPATQTLDRMERMRSLLFWRECTRKLARVNPGGAVWEMKEMLRVIARASYMDLLAGDRILKDEERKRMSETVRQRLFGAPLAYLLGEAPFLDFHVRVRPGVLIPRPETEILVAEALRWVHDERGQSQKGTVPKGDSPLLGLSRAPVHALDLGAGSGNITIGLCRGASNVIVDAVEVSPAALSVLRTNLSDHMPWDRVRVFELDYVKGDRSALRAAYDLIVANPPYIAQGDFPELPPEVQREPRLALMAGSEGDEILKYILFHYASRLRVGGRMILEMGIGQAQGLTSAVRSHSSLEWVEILRDEGGVERVLVLERR